MDGDYPNGMTLHDWAHVNGEDLNDDETCHLCEALAEAYHLGEDWCLEHIKENYFDALVMIADPASEGYDVKWDVVASLPGLDLRGFSGRWSKGGIKYDVEAPIVDVMALNASIQSESANHKDN